MSGLVNAVQEVYPEAKYQCCVVHFYRNIFSVIPFSKRKQAALMLKAIYAQETRKAAEEKSIAVAEEFKEMKLKES